MQITYNADEHEDSEASSGACVIPCMEVFSILLDKRHKRLSHRLSENERVFLFPLDLTEALVLVSDREGITFDDAPSFVGVPILSIRYSMPIKGRCFHFAHDFLNETVSVYRSQRGYVLRNSDRNSIFERRDMHGQEILQFMDISK